MHTQPYITLSGVFYPKTPHVFQVQEVHVSLRPGSWTALIGGSGLGKTTLLQAMSGFLPHDSVQAGFFDRRLVLPAHPVLMPWLTCTQFITLPDRLSQKTVCELTLNTALEITELHEYAQTYPSDLSSGLRQRLALAQFLYMTCCVRRTHPKSMILLLMDEPFSHLDSALKHRMIPKIKAMTHDTSVIFVTHDAEETTYADTLYNLTLGADALRTLTRVTA